LANLGEIVQKIRSKNAGPFWLTVDIFCGTPHAYEHVIARLSSATVAKAFGVNPQDIKRFDIANLHVVKFSLPRPHVQGSTLDPDMHGASWAALLAELPLEN
jgi:hypothetical protein